MAAQFLSLLRLGTTLRGGTMLARRRAFNVSASMKWYGDSVHRNISRGMTMRLKQAAHWLQREVRKNISIRVERTPQGVIRSKPGEYPRLDTGDLKRDIFWQMETKHSAIVGTTLRYGLVLETRMDRSFLRRTYREQLPTIRRILLSGKPIPGQQ